MTKKSDIKFDDEIDFLTKNPHFAIQRLEANYAAIRAILKAGGTLPGVYLVEIDKVPETKPIDPTARTLRDALAKKGV